VISDTLAPPHVRVKVFNHLSGESGTTFFADSPLEQWFEAEHLHPTVAGEFEDPALLKACGEAGRAVFPAPTAIECDVCRQYRVGTVGRTSAVRERYYAISAARRIEHPGVAAVTSAARTKVFG